MTQDVSDRAVRLAVAERVPRRTEPRILLRLLGGFELRADGGAVQLPLVVQRLLAFLAMYDRPLGRSFIAGSLWPDKPEERAAANLRSTLWRLRQPGLSVARCTATAVGLQNGIEIDVRELGTFCRRAIAGTLSVGDVREFDAGNFTLNDEILPDWYDEWLLVEREQLRQLRLHAAEQVCAVLMAHQRHAEAVDVALAAIAHEPLRESSHRTLIEIHLAEGNRVEAIRQFDRYRATLLAGLGLEPAPSIARLIEGL